MDSRIKCSSCGSFSAGQFNDLITCDSCLAEYLSYVENPRPCFCSSNYGKECSHCIYHLLQGNRKDLGESKKTASLMHEIGTPEYQPNFETVLQFLRSSGAEKAPDTGTFSVATDMVDAGYLMTIGYVDLRLIIQWTKNINDFSGLPLAPQICLLKNVFMDLSLFRLAYRSLAAGDGLVHFSGDLKLKLDDIYSQGWSLGLVNSTAEFIMRLDDLDLDYTEFCVLIVIILFSTDAVDLTEEHRAVIAEKQQKYINALHYYVTRYRLEFKDRFTKLLLKLPSLRFISNEAKKSFGSLLNQGALHMDALVAEIMEVDIDSRSDSALGATLGTVSNDGDAENDWD